LTDEYRTWVERYLAGGNTSARGITCPSNILFTTHPTYITLELKSVVCNVKVTANYMSYLIALLISWGYLISGVGCVLGENQIDRGLE